MICDGLKQGEISKWRTGRYPQLHSIKGFLPNMPTILTTIFRYETLLEVSTCKAKNRKSI